MITTERTFTSTGRGHSWKLYGLGDIHIGALNCAEKEFRRVVKKIQNDPRAIWVGGGDYCDAVILSDAKRFDVNTLPNWMLTGGANKVRRNIGDMVKAQQDRFLKIVDPIKDKCMGLIEGNHEYTVFKYHNRGHLTRMCDELGVPNLSDCAFMRLNFLRKTNGPGKDSTVTLVAFVCHGHGGGRTSGAEPNKLFRLAADKDADVVLTGHSHTFCILPPVTVLGIPRKGKLVEDAIATHKHAANWGSYVFTYQAGPSTYASRANYPVRPMCTVETVIKPHMVQNMPKDEEGKRKQVSYIDVTMNEVKL